MQIDTWFPTSILSGTIDADFKALIEQAYCIKKLTPNGSTWLCNTYNSLNSYNLQEDAIFKKVLLQLTEFPLAFAKYFNADTKNIVCTDAWINIAEPGGYQEYHVHPNTHFSLVLYLKTQPNCGNIVFQNPLANFDMYPLPALELNQSTFSTCSYTAQTGKVLCFRSNLPHMVQINNSTEDRISLALNFVLR